jgi:poly-gamma-glutamate synthesis protein (capsule biosynthesis protein)
MKEPILFHRGIEEGDQITMTAVGDILMQGKTQLAAQNAIDARVYSQEQRVASGFKAVFKPVVPDLMRGDCLIGNLETPIALGLTPHFELTKDNRYICEKIKVSEDILYDGCAYGETKYPKKPFRFTPLNFNSHPSLAIALRDIGFNIVSTANNHALDRGHNGVDFTIDSLRNAGLDFIGTLHSKDLKQPQNDKSHNCLPYRIKNVHGIHIAFFSFTSFINPVFWGFKDDSGQIFILPRKNETRQKEWFFQHIQSARKNPHIDFIVFSLHWGLEFISRNIPLQRRLAYEILDAGADVILGHHSHVLQPMEKYLTADGRETFIIYSLGNFISDMPGIRAQTSIILYLGITKNEKGTYISGIQYLPIARRCVEVSKSNHSQIQVVAIDRFPENEFSRHRKLVERYYGRGNMKSPDCDIDFRED